MLAITDHAEGTLSGVGREALLEQRARIRALQAELGDSLTLLHGVELNIGADGELDYDLEFRRAFDWCVASVHDHFELDRAAQTKRIVTAMHDPSVRMIGHLSARMIGARPADRPRSRRDRRRRRGDRHRARGERRLPAPRPVGRGAATARDRDVTFLLTSDAHHADELERVSFAALNAERAWLDPERVANAWSAERLIGWATGAG